MPMKSVIATVAFSMTVLAAACGQPPHTLSTSAGSPGTTSGPAGEKTVHYSGLAFVCLATWFVYLSVTALPQLGALIRDGEREEG